MIKKILLGAIKGYQKFISPMMAPHCRFTPTCSQYASIAIQQHGALKGTYLAVKRLLKCHPFHEGGLDPVPTNQHDHT